MRVAVERQVADRDDADRLAVLTDRKSPDAVLAHQLDRPGDRVVRPHGDQMVAGDLADGGLYRVAAVCAGLLLAAGVVETSVQIVGLQ